MNETMTESIMSDEMSRFYSTLAAAHSNAIFYVMSAEDAESMKTRATEITSKLETIANSYGGEKCEPGTIWNPVTQRCEPVLGGIANSFDGEKCPEGTVWNPATQTCEPVVPN